MNRVVILLVAAAITIMLGLWLRTYMAPKDEVRVVAVLMLDDFQLPILEGLKQGLARLGHDETTVSFDIRNARGDYSKLEEYAAALAAMRPAVICPLGSAETDIVAPFAREFGVPVVFIGVSNPLERNLVETLEVPGRAVTGVRTTASDLMPKRLGWIWMLLPEIVRVSVIYDPANPASVLALEQAVEMAPRFGFELEIIPLSTIEEIITFAGTLQPNEREILLATPSPLFTALQAAVLIPAAERAAVPYFGVERTAVDQGAILAYGPHPVNMGLQGARLVDRVLAGYPAALMPVETPDVIELSVNLQAARQLRVQLPKQVRWIAEYVVAPEEFCTMCR